MGIYIYICICTVYIYICTLILYCANIPSLHKKSWIHHIQATVRKESLPPLKNNTRRSQQVGASGANLGLVPRAKMAGCWIRTSAVNSGLHQVVGWWFVGNQYGICIYPVYSISCFTCLLFKKIYTTAWNMSSCCPTSNLLAALLENAPTVRIMLQPSCWPKWCSNSKLNIACNFRQLYNCNKPPSKNIPPPPNVEFFCIMRFSVSERLCDWTCS